MNTNKYSTIFGMDVHARSTTVCAVVRETGETQTKKFSNCPTPAEIASWMQTFPGPHYAAYESGCTGFHLCRELGTLGITCDVVAVSSIARSAEDKKKKNDKRDARRLASEIVKPLSDLSRVWLPDPDLEGARDVGRAYKSAVKSLNAEKKRLMSLLLRNGHIWNERTASGELKKTFTQAYWKWVDSITLASPGANDTLAFYKRSVKDATERVNRAKQILDTSIKDPRYKPYVDALCCLKGVSDIGAYTYTVEIGTFSRFSSGRTLPCWAGITPAERSSADTTRQGHITKAGNTYVRLNLAEGANALLLAKPTDKPLRKGACVSDEVRAHARCGNHRLIERAQTIKQAKKPHNVSKIAIANELIRWIWAIGCMVEEEQK